MSYPAVSKYVPVPTRQLARQPHTKPQVQRSHVNEPFSSGDLLLAMEIASAAAAAIAALRDRSRDAAVSAAALVVSACTLPLLFFGF